MAILMGSRLRQERIKKGLTQKELAELIGAKNTSISNWENDINKPDPDYIEKLCSIFSTSPTYLLMGMPESSFTTNLMPLPKTKKIPLLGTIACGEPILAVENIERFVEIPEYAGADFALRCRGDSMINSRIFDGDIVFVRAQPNVENGEIAAILIGDEATLKRVYKYQSKIVFRAENPLFDDMTYANEELEQIRILGKAVFFLSEVR